MKLVRPGIVLASAALAIVAPLGASAAASSPAVQPTASISGTVTGIAGVPIVDACVEAHLPDAAGGGFAAAPARTASDGSYTLSGLAAGQIVFLVDPSCAGAPTWDYVAYQATVQVTGGAASTINLTLSLGGTISGKILAPGSLSVGVQCAEAYTSPGSTVYNAYTAPDGSYQILGVPAGVYTVLFNDCYDVDNLRSAYYNNVQYAAQMTTVPVTAGADSPLANEVLLQGGELDVVVTYPGPTTANDITVVLQPVSAADDMGYNAIPFSDDLGTFGAQRMYGVQPGTYHVAYERCPTTCTVIGYYPGGVAVGSAASVQVTAGNIRTLTDQIGGTEPAYTATNVSVNMSPNPTVEFGNVTITAHVTTSAGQPVASGDVYFVDENGVASGPFAVDSNGDAVAVGTWGNATETLTATYVGNATYSRSSAQIIAGVGAPASGGGGGGGGGASPVTATVPAGGSVSSDPAGATGRMRRTRSSLVLLAQRLAPSRSTRRRLTPQSRTTRCWVSAPRSRHHRQRRRTR